MTRATRPDSLASALAALAEHDAVPIAGCTDLLVVDTATARTHASVVDVHRLPELRGIRVDGGALDVGAATTFTELRRDANVRAHAPALAAAAATVGGWQIQNRATLGGNIANASPAGDSLPVLLALGAELVLAGAAGERQIPYEEMHVGYRATALAPGELIVRVRLPLASDGMVQRFEKIGTRAAQAISKVAAFGRERHRDLFQALWRGQILRKHFLSDGLPTLTALVQQP
ncbi:MAG: FAD binding domain-containing protein [Planctomycetota bacterium]